MCGYCTEYAVIGGDFWRLKGEASEGHEPFLYPIYLQESADWRKELGSWECGDHPRGSLIALCRHWSERIAGDVPAPLSDVLATDALVDLQRWLATVDYPPEWQWAICDQGLLPNPLPIELARANLDLYINAWTESSCSDALAWNHETLYECFLGVSIAFDVVMRTAADEVRLKLLATLSPNLTPSFDGLDLWLQRRALHACVARSGVRFIKEHFNELRLEAILSVVWRDLLTGDALMDLHAWLKGRSRCSTNLQLADFLEALEMKADQLAREPSEPIGEV